jgi:hypothetical protein
VFLVFFCSCDSFSFYCPFRSLCDFSPSRSLSFSLSLSLSLSLALWLGAVSIPTNVLRIRHAGATSVLTSPVSSVQCPVPVPGGWDLLGAAGLDVSFGAMSADDDFEVVAVPAEFLEGSAGSRSDRVGQQVQTVRSSKLDSKNRVSANATRILRDNVRSSMLAEQVDFIRKQMTS